MSTKRGCVVGLVVQDLQLEYSLDIAKGVADYLKNSGANLVIYPTNQARNESGESEAPCINKFLIEQAKVDVLILTTAALFNFISTSQLRHQIEKLGEIDIVSIGAALKGYSSVSINNQKGMREAVRHLITEHKCQRIAFVRGPLMNPDAESRYQAYLETLDESNISVDREIVFKGNFTYGSGVAAAKQLMLLPNALPDAVVCVNDDSAMGVLDTFKKNNIRVPQDIAICGYDNSLEASYSSPALSSVEQPPYELGVKAAEVALSLIDKKSPSVDFLVDTRFVARESCGCLKDKKRNSAVENHSSESAEALYSKVLQFLTADFFKNPINIETQRLLANYFSKEHFDLDKLDEFIAIIKKESIKYIGLSHIHLMIMDNVDTFSCCAEEYIETSLVKAMRWGFVSCVSERFLSVKLLTENTNSHNMLQMRDALSFAARSATTDEFFNAFHIALNTMNYRYFYIYQYRDSHSVDDVDINSDDFGVVFRHHHIDSEKETEKIMTDFTSVNRQNSRGLLMQGEVFVVEPLVYFDGAFGHILYEWNRKDLYTRPLFSNLLSAKLSANAAWLKNIELQESHGHLMGEGDTARSFTVKNDIDVSALLSFGNFFQSAEKSIARHRATHKEFLLVFLKLNNYQSIIEDQGDTVANDYMRMMTNKLLNTFSHPIIISQVHGTTFVLLCPFSVMPDIQKKIDAFISSAMDDMFCDSKVLPSWLYALNQISPDSGRKLNEYIGDAEYLLEKEKRYQDRMKNNGVEK